MTGVPITKDFRDIKIVKDYMRSFKDTLNGFDLKILKSGNKYTLWRNVLDDDPKEIIRTIPGKAEVVLQECSNK